MTEEQQERVVQRLRKAHWTVSVQRDRIFASFRDDRGTNNAFIIKSERDATIALLQWRDRSTNCD